MAVAQAVAGVDTQADIHYCTRCGHTVEHREIYGRVRPVCPQCRRVHFIDPKVAAAVVIEREGKLLLIRRANDPERGKWAFPAGFVDGGENPARAAERESLEETGLTVRTTGVLDVFAREADNEGADILIVYRAEVTGGELQPGDDADRAVFFGPSEFPELAFPSTHQIVERWQTGR